MKTIFRFISSAYFAIILLTLAAFMVAGGTFIEAYFDSHLLAADWIYNHFIFELLLFGFFVNILASALRRYPFKRHHFPFLITHLGLLMIIGGVFVKNAFGLQGMMALGEGYETDQFALPRMPSLLIENRNQNRFYIPLEPNTEFKVENLKIEVIGYAPNGIEILEGWFKYSPLGKKTCSISGLPSLAVPYCSAEECLTLKPQAQVELYPSTQWNLYTLQTDDISKALKNLWIKDAALSFRDKSKNSPSWKGSLNQNTFMKLIWEFQEGNFMQSRLIWPPFAEVFLTGSNALLAQFPYEIDLTVPPSLILIENGDGKIYLVLFGPYGNLFSTEFDPQKLTSYYAYDKGFLGYAIQAEFPPLSFFASRKTRQNARLLALKGSLNEALKNGQPHDLIPPLQLLLKACDKSHLDPAEILLLCLKPSSAKNMNQLASFLSHLDPLNPPQKVLHQYKSLLKLYQINLQNLTSELHKELDHCLKNYFAWKNLPNPTATIESSLTHHVLPKTPLHKKEDNRPFLAIQVTGRGMQEKLNLLFDPSCQGWKWPGLNGFYLFRFQPQMASLPYALRLIDARQITYPGSAQARSYEALMEIRDKNRDQNTLLTLRMNEVYETENHTRFYLSNISPMEEIAPQKVILAVNRDPAKYKLTYPGIILVALGSILLFFRWFGRAK